MEHKYIVLCQYVVYVYVSLYRKTYQLNLHSYFFLFVNVHPNVTLNHFQLSALCLYNQAMCCSKFLHVQYNQVLDRFQKCLEKRGLSNKKILQNVQFSSLIQQLKGLLVLNSPMLHKIKNKNTQISIINFFSQLLRFTQHQVMHFASQTQTINTLKI